MNPTSSRFRVGLVLIQSLHIYGAVSVSALGWAAGILLGFETGDLWPLWFCGMLGAYNLDRLKHDPSDPINVPLRTRTAARFAPLSLGLVIGAAIFLVLYPVLLRDGTLAFLVAAGAFCAASYSLPLGGRRLKDLPWLKTLVPPVVVTAGFLAPAFFRGELPGWPRLLAVAAWLLCLLLANMLVCDARDVVGDRAAGVRSIPAAMGERAALRLAARLIVTGGLIALALGCTASPQKATWLWLAAAVPGFALPVIYAARIPRSEAFYEWLVEGMILVPACVVGVAETFR